jgi:hypothetical protein
MAFRAGYLNKYLYRTYGAVGRLGCICYKAISPTDLGVLCGAMAFFML